MATLSRNVLYLLIMVQATFFRYSSQENSDASSMVQTLTSGFVPENGAPVQHKTSLGMIDGRKEESAGEQIIVEHYYAFRGIPYAHAPVNDLRFADPVDATGPWPGNYLDATRYGNVCPQFDNDTRQVVGNEDCLTLNIFTPALPGADSEVSNGLPVLVFIHGGGFVRGASVVHSGSRLAGQNIVLVTINYRLGALGFLTTGDEVIPGNFGALDQISALRWVQRNIAEFGGDPNKVTIGGFSAGAGSAHSHMLSPLSKGLFRSAILVSGSCYCQWTVQKNRRQNAEDFAQRLNCPRGSSKDLKACLLSKTQEELLRAQNSMLRYLFWPLPFAFTIDGGLRKNPFLPKAAFELTHQPLPVLMALVPDDGLLFAINGILLSGNPKNATAAYNQLVGDLVSSMWFKPEEADLVAEAAETFYYTGEAKKSLNVLTEQMTEAMTDYLFHYCMSNAAIQLANNGTPVYMSLFTHRDPESKIWAMPLYKEARSLGITSPLLEEGVSHGDNLHFVFGTSKLDTTRDESVAQIQTSHWVSFITNGSPAVPKEQWPPLEPGGPVLFYNISSNPHMQKTPFRAKETNFWLQTIPFLQKLDVPTEDYLQKVLPWIVGAIMTYVALTITNRNH